MAQASARLQQASLQKFEEAPGARQRHCLFIEPGRRSLSWYPNLLLVLEGNPTENYTPVFLVVFKGVLLKSLGTPFRLWF